jgi:hypothetical protein
MFIVIDELCFCKCRMRRGRVVHGSVMPVNETYVVYKYTGIPRNVIEHTLLDHSLKYLKLTNFVVMVCRKKPVSLTFAIRFRSYQACGK